MLKTIIVNSKTPFLSILPLVLLLFIIYSLNPVIIANYIFLRMVIVTGLMIKGMFSLNFMANACWNSIVDLLASLLTRLKRHIKMINISFLVCFLVTTAEPSIRFLERQIPSGDLL